MRHGLPLRDAFAAHAADADAAPPASDAPPTRSARRGARRARARAPGRAHRRRRRGHGRLEAIVDAAWAELDGAGLAATLVVVCGKNEALRARRRAPGARASASSCR